MSKVGAAGSVTISNNVAGKRLGIKKYAGEVVKVGNIIVKQRGTVYHPGKNVKLSRDFSIYAMDNGVVAFRRMSGRKRGQYYIDVLSHEEVAETAKVVKKEVKTTKSTTEVTKVTKAKK